jgi:hypothetical protein
MVFAQADPFYHCGNHFVNNLTVFLNGNKAFKILSADTLTILPNGSQWAEFGSLNGRLYQNHHYESSAIIQVAQKHFPDRIAKGWEFGPGACFGVSLEAVKAAKRLLPELLEYSQSNPENPIHGDESHVMERIWKLIFTK